MPAAAKVLVIASGNAGKVREFGKLLADLGLETQQQPEGLEVEETGSTFAENARLKAEAVARATGSWALADDSGLSVDALGLQRVQLLRIDQRGGSSVRPMPYAMAARSSFNPDEARAPERSVTLGLDYCLS